VPDAFVFDLSAVPERAGGEDPACDGQCIDRPGIRSLTRAMDAQADRDTQFLNVDVDVCGKSDLQPLVAALGARVLVHYVGAEGNEQSAHFSLADAHRRDADTIVRRLAALIERLPPGARRLWDRARARDFNIGIQAGMTPFSHKLGVEPRTLALVVGVRGRLVITTYAPIQRSRRTRRNRVRRPARAR
jgi:hypothetical protein